MLSQTTAETKEYIKAINSALVGDYPSPEDWRDAENPQIGEKESELWTTEKQIKMLKAIEKYLNIEAPEDAYKFCSAAREFIMKHQPDLPKLKPRPPSEKQVEFAEFVSRETGVEIPNGAMYDQYALSQWITKYSKELPPTEKQMKYARSLAKKYLGGEDMIPDETKTNSNKLAQWIALIKKTFE